MPQGRNIIQGNPGHTPSGTSLIGVSADVSSAGNPEAVKIEIREAPLPSGLPAGSSQTGEQPSAAAIGKLFDEEGNIIKEGLILKIEHDPPPGKPTVYITRKDGKKFRLANNTETDNITLLPYGQAKKEDVLAAIMAIESFLQQNQETLTKKEIELAENIIQLLKKLNDSGQIYILAENANNIYGLCDGKVLLISKEFLSNPVAIFHEAGEGYFALYPEEAAKLGMSAHEYLRGAGKKERDSENFFRLGLQDKLFGTEVNNALSTKIGVLNNVLSPVKDYLIEQIIQFNKLDIVELKIVLNESFLLSISNNPLFRWLAKHPKLAKIYFKVLGIYRTIKRKLGYELFSLSTRVNLNWLAKFNAREFEDYAVMKNTKTGETLRRLYLRSIPQEFIDHAPPEIVAKINNLLDALPLSGFAQSPFVNKKEWEDYFSYLSGVIKEIGPEEFSSFLENITSLNEVGYIVENPAFKERLLVDGVSIVNSRETAESATGANRQTKGKFLVVSRAKRQEKSERLLKEIINVHMRLIDANFAALEQLSQGNLDRNRLAFVIRQVDEMLETFIRLAEGFMQAADIEAVSQKWRALKDELAGYSEAELKTEGVRKKIYPLRDSAAAETVDKVETLHGFINWLHQKSFSGLGYWAKGVNARIKVRVYDKELSLVDVSSAPLIQGSRVISDLLALLLSAFDEAQSSSINSTLIINDDTLIGHLALGLHQAEIQARLAPPDNGGYIRVRYQEWGTGQGNQARLEFIKRVMEHLGLAVEISEGKFMQITLDKDHHAKSLEEIKRILPLVLKLLYYTRDLDLYLKDTEAAQKAADLFFAQNTISHYQASSLQAGEAREETQISREYLPKLNQLLERLGLPKIPEGIALSQGVIDKYVNNPVEEGLGRGEFIRLEDSSILKNSFYHPVEDILSDLSGENGVQLIQIAEIVNQFSSLLTFKTIGFAGKFLLQIGTFNTADGVPLVVTILRDAESGNIAFARVSRRDNPQDYYTPQNLQKAVNSLGFKVAEPTEEVLVEEMDAYKQNLYERWEQVALGGATKFKGIAASSGTTGRRVLGRATFKKEAVNKEEGLILMVSHTVPDDTPIMSSFTGIITTGGGVLAHAAITARELGIPSIILTSAELVELNGEPAYKIVYYVPLDTEKTSRGFLVSRQVKEEVAYIKEGDLVLLDGREGTLTVETQAGALSGLAENQPVVTGTEIKNPLLKEELPAQKKIVTRKRLKGLIYSLDVLNSDDSLVAGAKGANLGEISRISGKLHFKVAKGFVVTTNAFERFREETGLDKEIKAILEGSQTIEEKSTAIEQLFLQASHKVNGELKKLIMHFAQAAKKGNIRWAVRSATIGEDSEGAAFAGQGNTYLFVSTANLFEAIIRNFASFATPRSLAYRLARGLSLENVTHAVVVQEMVDADVSGVIFTRDPVSNNPHRIVINASYGLGEGVVSGLVAQPDQYVVNKATVNEVFGKGFIGTKRTQVVRKVRGDGTEIISTPLSMRNQRSLSRQQVRRLSEIAKGLERHFGIPVDIEFAIKDGEIYILQVRPITTDIFRESSSLANPSEAKAVTPPKQQESVRGTGKGISAADAVPGSQDNIEAPAEARTPTEEQERSEQAGKGQPAEEIAAVEEIALIVNEITAAIKAEDFNYDAVKEMITLGLGRYGEKFIQVITPALEELEEKEADPKKKADIHNLITVAKTHLFGGLPEEPGRVEVTEKEGKSGGSDLTQAQGPGTPAEEESRGKKAGNVAPDLASGTLVSRDAFIGRDGIYTGLQINRIITNEDGTFTYVISINPNFAAPGAKGFFELRVAEDGKTILAGEDELKKYYPLKEPVPAHAPGAVTDAESPQANKPGGIDFRALPIQPLGTELPHLRGVPHLVGVTDSKLDNLDLDAEWRKIEDLLNQGNIPAAESIKEYIQASCLKGSTDKDIDKVIACISDILRLEEEFYLPTDPMLIDILIAVESANSPLELKAAFVGNL